MKYIKHILPPLCIIIVTIVIWQMFYVNMMAKEEENCWQELRSAVEELNNEIDIKLSDEISKLRLIETVMSNNDMKSIEEVADLYIYELKRNTMFSRIDILYPDGTLLSNGRFLKNDGVVNFDDIVDDGEHMTGRVMDPFTGKYSVYYVLPVESNDEVVAIISGVIELDTMYSYFKPWMYNGKANICIIDSSDGCFLMDNWHNELGNIDELESRQMLDKYKDIDFNDDIMNMRSGAIAFVSETTGQNLYMYYAPLYSFGWETAVFAQEEMLFSSFRTLRHMFIVAGTVLAALMVLYCIWNGYIILALQKTNRENEEKQKQLEYLSYRDVLTGLYNRYKYSEMLNSCRGHEMSSVGVVYIDLNSLKYINDSTSHEDGDMYIRTAAKVLSGIAGEDCYRIGGDEFVVLKSDVDEADFNHSVETLQESMKKERISISLGSLWLDRCDDLEYMVRRCEKRMYAEKREFYKAQNDQIREMYNM